jgi:hypothetical protein
MAHPPLTIELRVPTDGTPPCPENEAQGGQHTIARIDMYAWYRADLTPTL